MVRVPNSQGDLGLGPSAVHSLKACLFNFFYLILPVSFGRDTKTSKSH